MKSKLALLASLSALMAASHVRAETLSDVISYAYQTNPGIQAQRAQLRATDEDYVQARGAFEMAISANVSGTGYHDRIDSKSNWAPSISPGLTITQPLYTGGRLKARLSATEAKILAGREALRSAEIDLLQRVVTAYTDVLRDQQLLKINQDNVTALEREASENEARFKVREVTMTDVAQAKARLAQARSQLASAESSLDASKAEFVGTVGREPDALQSPPPLERLPQTIDEAYMAAESYNPQLNQARFTEEASHQQIVEAEGAVLPTVQLQFNANRSLYIPYAKAPYQNIVSTTLQISQPLFQGGQIASSIRQAKDVNAHDRLSVDEVHLELVRAVSTSWSQLLGARKQIESLVDMVKADEFAYYGMRQEQKNALRATIEVLNAELELASAQQELVRSRMAEYVSRVQLLANIGVLTPDLLAPGLEPYDAAKHLKSVAGLGSTPLSLPVKALEHVVSPPLNPPASDSVVVSHLAADALPPTPIVSPDAPVTSILSALKEAPPKP